MPEIRKWIARLLGRGDESKGTRPAIPPPMQHEKSKSTPPPQIEETLPIPASAPRAPDQSPEEVRAILTAWQGGLEPSADKAAELPQTLGQVPATPSVSATDGSVTRVRSATALFPEGSLEPILQLLPKRLHCHCRAAAEEFENKRLLLARKRETGEPLSDLERSKISASDNSEASVADFLVSLSCILDNHLVGLDRIWAMQVDGLALMLNPAHSGRWVNQCHSAANPLGFRALAAYCARRAYAISHNPGQIAEYLE